MRQYDYAEASENLADVLESAFVQDIVIANKEGRQFKLSFIPDGKPTGHSPFEAIRGYKIDVTREELLKAIKPWYGEDEEQPRQNAQNIKQGDRI